MRKAILLFICFYGLKSFSQNWSWLSSLGASPFYQIIPDAKGGFYACYVVNGPFVKPTLERFDSNGNSVWVKPWTNNTAGLACLSNNDLIANIVQPSAVIIDNDTIPYYPGRTRALIRTNENGSLQTYLQLKSSNYVLYLSTDEQDRIFISGIFTDTLNFKGQLIVNNSTTQKHFAVLCDQNFNLLWHRVIDLRADASSIMLDKEGNLIIAGHHLDTLVVDQQLYVPVSPWAMDGFLVKMTLSGQILWHRIIQGSQYFVASFDKQNNIYMGGVFKDSLRQDDAFISYQCNDIELKGENFALKFNSEGKRQWLTHIGKSLNQGSLRFFASPGGYLYFSGETFDTLMVNNTPMTGPKEWRLRMGALTSNGELSWSEIPKQYFSAGSTIYFNKSNEAFFLGFARFLKLGSDSISATDQNPLIFVAKMQLNEIPLSLNYKTETTDELTVYPNPSNGPIQINYSAANPYSLTLIGIDGKQLYQKWCNPHERRHEFPVLQDGTYILQLQAYNKNTIRRKILIQN